MKFILRALGINLVLRCFCNQKVNILTKPTKQKKREHPTKTHEKTKKGENKKKRENPTITHEKIK